MAMYQNGLDNAWQGSPYLQTNNTAGFMNRDQFERHLGQGRDPLAELMRVQNRAIVGHPLPPSTPIKNPAKPSLREELQAETDNWLLG